MTAPTARTTQPKTAKSAWERYQIGYGFPRSDPRRAVHGPSTDRKYSLPGVYKIAGTGLSSHQ